MKLAKMIFFSMIGIVFVLLFMVIRKHINHALGWDQTCTIYTGNDDIIYVTPGFYYSLITSESVPLNLKVRNPKQIIYIVECLAEPCSQYEYMAKIDSLQKLF